MRNWTAHLWDAYPARPMTTCGLTRDRAGVTIEGPDSQLDMEFTVETRNDVVGIWVPVAVLANHLRLAGWTVTPPEALANEPTVGCAAAPSLGPR